MKSKVFDLTEKFTTERPILKIGAKEYPIDNSTETSLSLSNIESDKISEIEYILKFLGKTLGEDAVKDLNIVKYPLGAIKELFYAVTSAITEEDMETVKARFQGNK